MPPRFYATGDVRSCSLSYSIRVDENIGSAFIDPGKPWQNRINESFNGTLRDECLGLEWFRSRPEAVVVIETIET